MLLVSKRVTGFCWVAVNRKLLVWTAILLTINMLAACRLPLVYSAAIGVILAALTAWFSLKTLTRLTGKNPLTTAWQKLINAIPVKINGS